MIFQQSPFSVSWPLLYLSYALLGFFQDQSFQTYIISAACTPLWSLLMFSLIHSSMPVPPVFLFPQSIIHWSYLQSLNLIVGRQNYSLNSLSIPLPLMAHLTCLSKPHTWVNLTLWGLCTCIHDAEWLASFYSLTSCVHRMGFPSLLTLPLSWVALSHISPFQTPDISASILILIFSSQPFCWFGPSSLISCGSAPDHQTSSSATLTPLVTSFSLGFEHHLCDF